MEQSGWRRIADLLADAAAGMAVGPELAQVSTSLLGVDEVSLALTLGEVPSIRGTSPGACALCERQFTLGEGPAVDALTIGEPVVLEDLSGSGARRRYPVLLQEEAVAGVGAMVAFPIAVGAALIGVMSGSRSLPGPVDEEHLANGLIVSRLAATALIGRVVEGGSTPEGEAKVLDDAINVAMGMVAEQLDVSVLEALARLRAHAFTTGAALTAVARMVVERAVRIER